MERVRFIRFEIHDSGHYGPVHGDYHRGTPPSSFIPCTYICKVIDLVIGQLVWGPLCLLVAFSIFIRSSLRHPLQLTVCLSHLYGDSLYYATSLYDHYVHERPYCRPEPFYFWVYYFFMNFIWIVVPLCRFTPLYTLGNDLLRILDYFVQSVRAVQNAFDRLAATSADRKTQ